jgi:hypothetical protein
MNMPEFSNGTASSTYRRIREVDGRFEERIKHYHHERPYPTLDWPVVCFYNGKSGGEQRTVAPFEDAAS